MDRSFFLAGCFFALLAVGAGAFGAHALTARITPERLATYEVAVRYQMYHALALLALAWATTRWNASALQLSGWLFVLGIVIFSGTLYALALGGPRWLGAVTPLGGLCFLLAWGAAIWGVGRG